MLGTPENAKRALVFLRHQYYLRIPYLNGDPGTSFEVDPERLKTPEQWKGFLKAKGIVYVVRSPDYPVVIAVPLEELEKRGELVRFAQREVGNLQGMRIEQVRITVPVVILKVHFQRDEGNGKTGLPAPTRGGQIGDPPPTNYAM